MLARRHLACLVVLLALAACRRDPLEEPRDLVARGNCTDALPLLYQIEVRDDVHGTGARTLVARCRWDLALADPGTDEQTWREVGRLLLDAREEVEVEGARLPPGVDPVDASMTGDVQDRLMAFSSDAGKWQDVLDVAEEYGRLSDSSPRTRIMAGKARLGLGQWVRGASDLEASAEMATTDSERAALLRIAAGGWYLGDQPEKALVAFARARSLDPLDWQHPDRLIPEGEEMQHVLGELLAAAVHGVLVQGFARDWVTLTDDPQAFNFFVQKRGKDFLEAQEEIETLHIAVAEAGDDEAAASWTWYLYHIVVARALYHASGGDYASARVDLETAMEIDPDAPEAPANLSLLEFWEL